MILNPPVPLSGIEFDLVARLAMAALLERRTKRFIGGGDAPET